MYADMSQKSRSHLRFIIKENMMDTIAIILWTITGTSAAWALYLGYNINKAIKCLSRNLDQLKEDCKDY
tara:strand:+ start:1389 stop:1595 length:207 start_codon:yes stop_codon:yes gene_type:complete